MRSMRDPMTHEDFGQGRRGFSPAEVIFRSTIHRYSSVWFGTIGIGVAIDVAIVYRTRVLPTSVPIPTPRFEQLVIVFETGFEGGVLRCARAY